jgi:hypothetical protein
MRSSICVLTPNQAFQLEFNGILPSCRDHRHLSRGQADQLLGEKLVYRDDHGDFARIVEARWVGKGKRYLTFVRSREWKRRDSAGTVTMQLVPAGGVW